MPCLGGGFGTYVTCCPSLACLEQGSAATIERVRLISRDLRSRSFRCVAYKQESPRNLADSGGLACSGGEARSPDLTIMSRAL